MYFALLRPRFVIPLALFLALAGLMGCSGGSGRATVQGKVNYDGNPVDNGGIVFIPLGGGDNKATGQIVDGKYALDATRGPFPGKHKVEIIWTKKTGKLIPTPGDPGNKTEETKQVIPAKYNTKSELTVDVTPGRNTFDFELMADKRK